MLIALTGICVFWIKSVEQRRIESVELRKIKEDFEAVEELGREIGKHPSVFINPEIESQPTD
ncbi:hypothetical protein [Novipirellula sp.]|uniref:hypothetical protein n=1 Tax=Novipirellula sp. TaxID=2795430 RepID=UPI003565A77F